MPGLAGIVVAGLMVCGAAPLARAATSISPFATVSVAHDSNVFMRPSDLPPLAAEGITALGDTIQEYTAGMAAQFNWGAEHLRLNADGKRDRYNRFSFLDHTRYKFGGDLDWRLSPMIDGRVSYTQRRYMAPFTYTLSTQLLLDTDRTAQASLRVLASRQWRIDLTPQYLYFDIPLPGYPDFRVRQKSGTVALDYLGFGKLTAGLQFEYGQGRFAGIVAATRYDQRAAHLTARYKVSGFSTFDASAGYTVRDSKANPSGSVASSGARFGGYVVAIGRTSGVTGSLTYHRQITGKTSAYLSLFRQVQSYAAGANPEIVTGGDLGVHWKPDPKFTVSLDYGLTREKVQGGLIVAGVANRRDYIRQGRLSICYAVLSWLTIRPYVNWDRQTSTFRLANFSSTIVGVDVTGRLFSSGFRSCQAFGKGNLTALD